MKKALFLASLAVVSASLYGMQDSFNDETNIRGTNSPRLPLAFSDDSVMEDTVINGKELPASVIQWDIFENQEKTDQKTQKDVFSDSSDSVYLPSVDEIFKEILNPKGKTGQSETFDDIIQLPIDQPDASGSAVLLPKKDEAVIGDKRKVSENNETEKDSLEKKRIKTSDEENNFKSTTSDKENSPKNIKPNKKRYFAKKTGLKTEDFLKNDEIKKLEKEISQLKSRIKGLKTSIIRLQTRQEQLKSRNNEAEDSIETLQNLVLEKEVELELEKSKGEDNVSQQAKLENQNNELIQQNDQLKKEIDCLKQQIKAFQAKEKQVEELNLKIAEQIKKITNLERLLKDRETEVQRIHQINKDQTQNQELAKLKAKLEIQQTDNEFEHLYQQAKQQLDEVEKSLEDSKNEIKKIQFRYETELNKKEGYKSEVNRLNQVISDEKVKSEQQKKENEQNKQANNTLNRILLGERLWQNILKPLNASQKKNEDLREYLLRLMKHSSTRSLINRFSKDEYSEGIVRQLTHDVDIKEHFKILDTNQYYWSTSKIGVERDLFSKSKGYDKDLLNELQNRNNRAQKQLSKMDKDNEFLMQIIRELKRDEDIKHYIHDALELYQPELTAKINIYLTQDKSV